MNALGRHILVEYFDCDPEILNDVVTIEELMVEAAKNAEATVINSTFHHFSPFGVSGVVVIQESHLAIHTWPEYGYAAVDIFTCGDTVDPWVAFHFLKGAFKANHASPMEALRGQSSLLKKIEFDGGGREPQDEHSNELKRTRDVWFTERNEEIALSLRHTGDRLFLEQSPFQKVEIYDTHAYGRLLALDGMVMTTEKDEYVYHEMITHIPLQTLPDAKRVLIIGGGDGGAARECLRYDNIEEVVLVEIDEAVIRASKEFLPEIASAFSNERLNLKVEDGIKYVKECADESFDLVIVDSTDPVGPAEGLFTPEFYGNVHRILKDGGIQITQSESPRFNTKVFREIFECYRGIYGAENVHCYLAFIPTYPTGMWSFSYSAKGSGHPLQGFDEIKAKHFSDNQRLSYYNDEIHKAAFALPGFVRKLLEPSLETT